MFVSKEGNTGAMAYRYIIAGNSGVARGGAWGPRRHIRGGGTFL